MRKGPPCKDCKKRFVGCHSICEQYLEWKADNDATREKQQQAKAIEWMVNGIAIQWHEKICKKQHLP